MPVVSKMHGLQSIIVAGVTALTVSSAQAQTAKILNLTSATGLKADRVMGPDQEAITSDKKKSGAGPLISMVALEGGGWICSPSGAGMRSRCFRK